MSKRDYKITPIEMSFGISYKTEMWDEYGNYSCVYKRSVEDSSEYIYDWWEETEERKKSNDLKSRAIHGCQQIDEKSGILKGNRDGLD